MKWVVSIHVCVCVGGGDECSLQSGLRSWLCVCDVGFQNFVKNFVSHDQCNLYIARYTQTNIHIQYIHKHIETLD